MRIPSVRGIAAFAGELVDNSGAMTRLPGALRKAGLAKQAMDVATDELKAELGPGGYDGMINAKAGIMLLGQHPAGTVFTLDPSSTILGMPVQGGTIKIVENTESHVLLHAEPKLAVFGGTKVDIEVRQLDAKHVRAITNVKVDAIPRQFEGVVAPLLDRIANNDVGMRITRGRAGNVLTESLDRSRTPLSWRVAGKGPITVETEFGGSPLMIKTV